MYTAVPYTHRARSEFIFFHITTGVKALEIPLNGIATTLVESIYVVATSTNMLQYVGANDFGRFRYFPSTY